MPPPMTNITIAVPVGTSNHGDPGILCVPSKWTDILLFFAVNYLAHAVTIKSLPGEKLEETGYIIATALLYPYSGLLRGVEAITRRAAWCRGNELQKAARAGALCVVIRDGSWQPGDGQIISGCEIALNPETSQDTHGEIPLEQIEPTGEPILTSWFTVTPSIFSQGITRDPVIGANRTVHGARHLPPGYTLAFLPSNSKIESGSIGDVADVSISSSYSLVKSVVAIVQVVFASATIYKTRGDQVKRYGYAAFGLTVLPYIIMSIVNLLGNLLTPDFPTMFLVRSAEMAEAESRGGWFDGVVGTLAEMPTERGITVQFWKTETGFKLHPAETPALMVREDGDDLGGQDTIFTRVKAGQQPRTKTHVFVSFLKQPFNSFRKTKAISFARFSRNVQYRALRVPGSTTDRPIRIQPSEQTELLSRKLLQINNDQTEIVFGRVEVLAGFVQYVQVRQESGDAGCTYHLKVPTASAFLMDGLQAWGLPQIIVWTFLSYVMSTIPLVVIGALTLFDAGSSTVAQRVWTMGWLVVGTFFGSVMPAVLLISQTSTDEGTLSEWAGKLVLIFFYGVFAVGGFVTVGQMLTEYGNCIKIS